MMPVKWQGNLWPIMAVSASSLPWMTSACFFTHTHTHTDTHTHIRTHTHAHTHTHTRTQAHTHTDTHTSLSHTHTHTHTVSCSRGENPHSFYGWINIFFSLLSLSLSDRESTPLDSSSTSI